MKEVIKSATIALKGMAPLLQVFDMPTSLRFYRDTLGFKVVESSDGGDNADWVLLKLNDVDLMLNTAYEKNKRPPFPDTNRVAAHADTTLYFGCPDVDETCNMLVEKGLALGKPELTGYGWKALNLTDPDGYQLCFHWPPEEDKH